MVLVVLGLRYSYTVHNPSVVLGCLSRDDGIFCLLSNLVKYVEVLDRPFRLNIVVPELPEGKNNAVNLYFQYPCNICHCPHEFRKLFAPVLYLLGEKLGFLRLLIWDRNVNFQSLHLPFYLGVAV